MQFGDENAVQKDEWDELNIGVGDTVKLETVDGPGLAGEVVRADSRFEFKTDDGHYYTLIPANWSFPLMVAIGKEKYQVEEIEVA